MAAPMKTSAGSAVAMAIDQMVRHSGERLTLERIAASCGLSATRLRRDFRLHTGMTVHEFLTRQRMQTARDLLESGEKVEWVAGYVGYASRKNFYRQYRKQFGRSPRRI
jgi:transcriptional regulator GlxA family with amidase domain